MPPATDLAAHAPQPSGEAGLLIGCDVGGTFTDVVVADRQGDISVHKAFTTAGREADGVFDALEKAAHGRQTSLSQLLAHTVRFVHGSTVAANALIEKKGAAMAFLTTRGFRDTLVMRRMFRENMYDLRAPLPESIIARDAIIEVGGRIDRDGKTLEPLTESDIDAAIARLAALEPQAIGISLLFAFRNPAVERRLRDAIARQMPDVYIAVSSDIAPEIRDYERASTTLLCAYLGPKASAYLYALERRLRDQSLACELQIMRSDGGVCSVDDVIRRPTDLLLSGPAGGVVAAMTSEELRDEPDLISFDMGGTSCDISLVREGRAVSSTYLPRHSRFEGWDVLTPFLDIHTLGSGGGSIVWSDRGGGLHVGPRSAGSSPGPACYGTGGREPTVTDANLVLGYLDADNFFGREIQLDRAAAEASLRSVGGPLGLSPEDLAVGVFDIVNAAMADRIRVVLADRGDDPQEFTLLCFGGAGAIHAPAVMRELGIRRVIVPRTAPGFSALGFLYSDERRDSVHTVSRELRLTQDSAIRAAFDSMQASDHNRALGEWSYAHQAEMRYRGQTHDIRVEVPDGSGDAAAIERAFEDAYSEMFGYLNDPSLITLTNLRLIATRATERPPQVRDHRPKRIPDAPPAHGERRAFFAELDRWTATPVHDGLGLVRDCLLPGPAIVELPATTIVVRPGQELRIDPYGNFTIDRLEA